MPKKVKRYCPKCRKHTVQDVIRVKSRGNRGSMTKGQRRHERRGGIKGYGGFPQPKKENSARHNRKTSKKIDLRFKCRECGKQNTLKNTFRARKFEIVKIGV